jgi:hypothetical protein
MAALAEVLKDSSSWASIADIQRHMAGEKVTLTSEQIKASLSLCIDEEFVEHSGQDAYRFRIDLLRHWISTGHPLWKIAEDSQ